MYMFYIYDHLVTCLITRTICPGRLNSSAILHPVYSNVTWLTQTGLANGRMIIYLAFYDIDVRASFQLPQWPVFALRARDSNSVSNGGLFNLTAISIL